METAIIAKCRMEDRMKLRTSVGTLVPSSFLKKDGSRTDPRISYFPSGELKSVTLEESAFIKTSVGVFSSERVAFYRSGKLRKIFPQTGFPGRNSSGAVDIDTLAGTINVEPEYLQFYETGEIKRIVFQPSEVVELYTPAGMIKARKGVFFHRNGTVARCEPAAETIVQTPIGRITAYNPDPESSLVGGETLAFNEDGRLTSVCTVKNIIVQNPGSSNERLLSPDTIQSYCDEDSYILLPLNIRFEGGYTTCENMSGIHVLATGAGMTCIKSYMPDKKNFRH
ncbi:MAG: hypothetical protein PQJ61_06430 [Spirochaetales bacterium]|uniref:Uncharacterized protein n=1 Tax=Candidatus Thalassospirochaeta sargassi TaxID=3119039 RepID=A0AAJ1MJ99_9SPIO|nr:hypothetical protein [Spirochaetales bacterium]